MNPNYIERRFPQIRQQPLDRIFKSGTPPDIIDFLSGILVYSPQLRPTALQSLAHPCFDVLRDENTRLPNGNPLPSLFNWTPEERSAGNLQLFRQLTPRWFRA
mmetsp:Transcript_11336/g.11417  ORF Transcript_11336/g.11417 Transcript_11336/m.11417 type:complete len:103 (+) Transcript_11336:880-1188(+)